MSKKSAVAQFVHDERKKGKDDKEIQHQLLDAGWQMDLIKHALEDPAETPKTVSPSAKADSFRLKKLHWLYAGGLMLVILLFLALFL